MASITIRNLDDTKARPHIRAAIHGRSTEADTPGAGPRRGAPARLPPDASLVISAITEAQRRRYGMALLPPDSPTEMGRK